ncbi:putative f-box domain protein [Diplodia seriata]|uniref:Putative f-box domain protein n=1 Tax=Diplodia seriata TaxID=420778 RepID=A0A0G2GF35_9PEZI|nr:putative f-box domain protein [Diplodia seriata]
MASGILQLPEELRCNIAHHLEKEDICSLRLASKQLHAAATQALFSFVRLYPYKESISRYNSILDHEELNRHVRHVELNTLDTDEEEQEVSGEAELDDECLEAFKLVRKFPNLASATLRFSKNATSGNSWQGFGHYMQWTEWPETYQFRQSILQSFFKTLARPCASKVKDVCIDNIQNMNDVHFMKSEPTLKVLSRLTALRLYIATEDHDAAPECNLEMEDWSRIFHHIRTQLTSLRHFRTGTSTRWMGRYDDRHYFHPSEYEDLTIGLYDDRYQIFDMGIGPCQYTDRFPRGLNGHLDFHERDGKGTVDGDKWWAFVQRLEEQGREDRDALVELLNAIGQPIPKDTEDVSNLMGRK